jgi:hypothetical protein
MRYNEATQRAAFPTVETRQDLASPPTQLTPSRVAWAALKTLRTLCLSSNEIIWRLYGPILSGWVQEECGKVVNLHQHMKDFTDAFATEHSREVAKLCSETRRWLASVPLYLINDTDSLRSDVKPGEGDDLSQVRLSLLNSYSHGHLYLSALSCHTSDRLLSLKLRLPLARTCLASLLCQPARLFASDREIASMLIERTAMRDRKRRQWYSKRRKVTFRLTLKPLDRYPCRGSQEGLARGCSQKVWTFACKERPVTSARVVT